MDQWISPFNFLLYIPELNDLNSMATCSPNVSKSSGTFLLKFNAWLRHSSSDKMVLPDFHIFIYTSFYKGCRSGCSSSCTITKILCSFLRGFCRGNLKMTKQKLLTLSETACRCFVPRVFNSYKVSFFSVPENNRRMAQTWWKLLQAVELPSLFRRLDGKHILTLCWLTTSKDVANSVSKFGGILFTPIRNNAVFF